ncbi:MAG: SUMF1/EgtB/PvdO family nonheme iron enzyme [Nitrospinae bacterium]|nr:SUMF1/EgtB/PvdO family nonheme iron enzyme [Nitrospinota bacterium]
MRLTNSVVFRAFSCFSWFVLFLSNSAFGADAPEGMAYVKGGCYSMGDVFGGGHANEKPQHEVCVNDFFIDKYLVSQKIYKSKTGTNPSNFSDCPKCPVETITWDDAAKYCAGLGKRLPTEAEWEYAARSGGKREKFAGIEDEKKVTEYAWFFSNATTTVEIGTKNPNRLGLYDMSGNVWEWMSDFYDKRYYEHSPKDNPKGLEKGATRSLRGGSYTNNVDDVRTTIRSDFAPDRGLMNVCFRCAK